MKHIETTCEEEKKARREFAHPKADAKPVVATDEQKAKILELLALRHKMDQDALRASAMKAEIMNMMGFSDSMVDNDGTKLVSWVEGSTKKSVDYAGLFKKYGVKDEDVAAYTKTKVGTRTFSIELD